MQIFAGKNSRRGATKMSLTRPRAGWLLLKALNADLCIRAGDRAAFTAWMLLIIHGETNA
jgi:hypothetical protein